MSEEITTEEKEEERVLALPTTKDVEIDITINDVRYCGTVSISLDDCHDINLHNLLDDYDLYARFHGHTLCKVCHILAGEALYKAGEGFDDDIEMCCETGWHADRDFMVCLDNGDYCFSELAYWFDNWDAYVPYSQTSERECRDSDGYRHYMRAPDSWWDDRHYCERCDCYLEDDDDYYYDYDECRWCYDEDEGRIIEGYSESHEHEPIFFGDYKDEDSFVGLGFELEVDCDCSNSRHNEETARGLCSASGLEEDEMRFAHDGSLNYGFECISQPHTVKDFWSKQGKWQKMLKYLSENGYKSHDPGTCGLHVHVSRGMFGSTHAIQDKAIAKVYTFFDDNWDDIVKISRRRSLSYCHKNELYDRDLCDIQEGKKTKFECWKKKSKCEGGHGVALNNANHCTFEYRLGRGTLNSWSFFSWIDFVLTLTKNAKRITIGKVETNDIVSWLGGISESTAKYIYKRGAFQKEMLALYPNIEWEQDLIERD
jgi:hypothetical protein